MNIDEVIAEYGQTVYRLARARTPCRQDAEDVFQEVFCRLARRNPRLDGGDHLKAWLIRATLNCAASLARSSWRRHNVLMDAPEGRPEAKGNTMRFMRRWQPCRKNIARCSSCSTLNG